MPEAVLPDITEAPYSTAPRVPKPNSFRQHPQWPEIHADITTTVMTPRAICEKYDLRTESGSYAVLKVAMYRKKILERFKDLFAAGDQLERQILRNEVLTKIRGVYDAAAEGNELAKNQKHTTIGRGKDAQPITVDMPNFSAMKDSQETMTNAATTLAQVAGVVSSPAQQGQTSTYQDNRVVTILALPKQEGVNSKPPLKVIDARKSL